MPTILESCIIDFSMDFNPGQLAAIQAKQNAVILAGAGSGKTTVLAERFLYLIEEQGAAIDQVLCLTFTRKAAAEMYERIYARLSQAGSEHARRQLQNFDRAQISTLDSFCLQIVRNWSQRFGLAPDFTCEDTRPLAEEAALDFMLSHGAHPALTRFLDEYEFQQLQKGLFTWLACEYFTLAGDFDLQSMFQAQQAELSRQLERSLATLLDCRKRLLGLPPSTKTIEKNQAVLQKIPDLHSLAAQGAYAPLQEYCAGLKLSKAGGGRNPDLLVMKELVDEIRCLQETLGQLLDTLQHSALIHEMLTLLEEFQSYFNGIKRARNVVSFADVSTMAVRTLLENKALRRYYKNRFRYIMIDEFQDNNALQKQLLFLLAEKLNTEGEGVPPAGQLEADKLFFVGDDKQSIYRFRGAEVSVFKQLSRELTGGRRPSLNLDLNYRSHPGLITFFNELFAGVLANEGEAFAADFQPLEAPARQNAGNPQIVFMYKPYDREAGETPYSNDEAEAFAVAGYIHRAVDEGHFLLGKQGEPRPATYDDFTVLMRSTSNQIIYEKMFRLFGIPYSCQSPRSLFLEAPVNDIYNLLQLAVYPWDRVAYAAYLRSPLVNLADDTLLTLLQEKGAPFSEATELSAPERCKWQAGAALYQKVRELADNTSLQDLLAYIWYSSGYRYYLLAQSQYHNFLEYYIYLSALAERYDEQGETLSVFLDFLRDNLGKYEKLAELEILKPQVAGVQLMTIHKAKGLEFEIVVLANTGNRGRTNSGKRPCWVSEEYGLSLNVGQKNWFQKQAEAADAAQELAEIKRLLYVALTRARSHLILSGVHNRQNLQAPTTHLNMLRENFAFPAAGETRQTPDYTVTTLQIPELEEEVYKRHSHRRPRPDFALAVAAYTAAPLVQRRFPQRHFSVRELNRRLAARLPAGEPLVFPELPIDSALSTEASRMQFGSLSHFIIEQELKGGYSAAEVPVSLQTGFPAGCYAEIERTARELAANFLKSPLGQQARQADTREAEFPFLYRLTTTEGPCYIRGIMDLFFTTAQQAWVVDFKSDLKLDRNHYLLQLGLYALALEEWCGKPVECYLFPLRSGTALRLTEEVDATDVKNAVATLLQQEAAEDR